MAVNFGASTSDSVFMSFTRTFRVQAQPILVAGWWNPTTLTAGRAYWGSQASPSAMNLKVGPTTSELQFNGSASTTSSQWDTTGAGITTNQWYFIACLSNQNTNSPVSEGVTIWIGTETSPPTEVTITKTTAYVGSPSQATIFVVGNEMTAGTVAFQGDAADITVMYSTDVGTSTTTQMFGQTTSDGTIDAAMKTFTFDHHVSKLWLGEFPTFYYGRANGINNWECDVMHWSGIGANGNITFRRGNRVSIATPTHYVVTQNGSAANSDRRHPRPHRLQFQTPYSKAIRL